MLSRPIHPQLSARRRTNGKMVNALAIAQVGSLDWNLVSGTHTWSRELHRIFGLTPGTIAPTYDAFVGFAHPDDRVELESAISNCRRISRRFSLDYRVQRADLEVRVVHAVGEILLDRLHLPSQLVLTVQDVTESNRHKERRDQSLAIITHDLKNAIAIIRGQAQFQKRLLEDVGMPAIDRLAHGLQSIDTAGAQMMSMIDELLDLANLKDGQNVTVRPEAVDLHELASERVSAYSHLTTVHSLSVVPLASPVTGRWDRGLIARVLDNLLSNAIKYSPQGGNILVTVGNVSEGSQLWAECIIQDQGIGIDAADLPFLGESVRRGSNVGVIAGTGLGLVGVRQIVAQHGGTLTSAGKRAGGNESEYSYSTTFRLRLPLTD